MLGGPADVPWDFMRTPEWSDVMRFTNLVINRLFTRFDIFVKYIRYYFPDK